MNTDTQTPDTSSPAPQNESRDASASSSPGQEEVASEARRRGTEGEGAIAGGPRTEDGKRVAARNATTHGLFARDVVLTHLGEDPRGYEALLSALAGQLQPKNMLEQHYVEKIAAASWRLRRLQRWQAQLFENPDITEDEALAKLDRVMRHETNLHRQIDTSVKTLARDLPKLFQDRVRAELIQRMNVTEKECREDPMMNEFVISQTRQRIPSNPIPDSLKDAPLDASSPAPHYWGGGASSPAAQTENEQICQNELPLAPVSAALPPNPPVAGGPCEQSEQGGGHLDCTYIPDPPPFPRVKTVNPCEEEENRRWQESFGKWQNPQICQNEPSSPSPRIGRGSVACDRGEGLTDRGEGLTDRGEGLLAARGEGLTDRGRTLAKAA